jgi:hypothetical protein
MNNLITFNNDNQGFHKTFDNGFTVSVQWREGTYSSRNYDGSPITCEIAAWDDEGTWFQFDDGENVRGWQTAAEINDFMKMVEAQ